MKFQLLSIAVLWICFIDSALSSAIKTTEKGSTLSVSLTPSVAGSDATKVRLSLPTGKGNYEKIAAQGSKLVNDVIQNMDAAQQCLKEVPFLNFSNWQKYHALALKEYIEWKDEFGEKKEVDQIMDEAGDLLGKIHDDVLPRSCDDKDDGKLDSREVRIIHLVKLYMKESLEKYIDIPIDVNETNLKIEDANQKDAVRYSSQISRKKLVLDKVKKPKKVIVDCYLDDDAISDGDVLKPDEQVKEFAELNKIPLTGKDPYSIKKVSKSYFCDSEKIKSSFVVHKIEIEFRKKNSKNNKKRKTVPGFSYVQTYVDGQRVAITDNYRIKINLKNKAAKKRSRSSSRKSSSRSKGSKSSKSSKSRKGKKEVESSDETESDSVTESESSTGSES